MAQKHKHDGVSLLVALGGSLLVLAIAMATLISISKSLEQSSSIERSTKIFFAAESGIEAAFFHHNARGAGTHFPNGDIQNAGNYPQQISHLSDSVTNKWEIEGRFDPIIGLLSENQTVQIPLHWDSSVDPWGDPALNEDSLANPDTLTLTFYDESSDMGSFQTVFEEAYDAITINTGTFDFNDVDNEILIDWSLARTHSTGGIQTFSPTFSGGDDCEAGDADGFVCENELGINSTITLDDSTSGRILPGNTSTTLEDFFDCAGGGSCSNYVLTFRPLLKFESTGGDKVLGIPFSVEASSGGSSAEVPSNLYTVTSEVSIDDFSQAISIEVPERTAIGAFDYVIFD